MKHNITYHKVSRETFVETDTLVDEQRDVFKHYVERLLWWNKRVNLVSRSVSRETLFEHIRHSLLVSALHAFKKASFVVDAGTGGGLPGIPLSITNKKKKFLLNDVVSKKVLAVKQIISTLALTNIESICSSIADLPIEQDFLLISKHAFKINNLYHLTKDLPWNAMILFKGLPIDDELENINVSMTIEIHTLQQNANNKFYNNKAIVVVKR